MIVLDTNVISELMRADGAHPAVLAFADSMPASTLYTAAIVEAEILAGVGRLPKGRRRSALEAEARRMFAEDFSGRVLPFDRNAAGEYAVLLEMRREMGRPLDGFDGLIAAIARAAGFKVATRNIRDFEGCEIDLVDPWASAA